MEDVYALQTQYSQTYGLDSLRVQYTSARGYFLTCPSSSVAGGGLPDIFIQCSVAKKTITCSTEELNSLRCVVCGAKSLLSLRHVKHVPPRSMCLPFHTAATVPRSRRASASF